MDRSLLFVRCLPLLFSLQFALAQPDLSEAKAALKEFGQVCAKEGGALWGVSLCGPLILVEPRTRSAVANAPDPDGRFEEKDGLFFGSMPGQFLLANTSIRWGPDEWAMVVLPLPNDVFSRVRLLAHESFHRVQKDLNLNASDAANAHLDSESGRLWLRLELRALAKALRSDGRDARSAAGDALLFRAVRRSLSVGASGRETALEMQEGIAEFTGTVVALKTSGESVSRVARQVETFEDQATFSRSFAYATGPAVGLLLDRYAGAWRRGLRRDTDLASLLAKALGIKLGANPIEAARLRATVYAFPAVAADEKARDKHAQVLFEKFRKRFIEGTTLSFPRTQELRRSFNPNNLVTLGDHGTVYPTGTFMSRWGRLQVDDVGALLSPDNQALRVAAPDDPGARPLVGPGWRLELAPGWTVQTASMAGSFEVVPEKQ